MQRTLKRDPDVGCISDFMEVLPTRTQMHYQKLIDQYLAGPDIVANAVVRMSVDATECQACRRVSGRRVKLFATSPISNPFTLIV